MRIEINLTEEVATALQTKAEALNHSRKSYIEFLCIKEALPSDGDIETESGFYATHLDFTHDKALNDKGRKRVEEWCKADFVAGAKWMRERAKGNVV